MNASLPAAQLLAPRERLAFALDVHSLEEANVWIERLAGIVGVFKVGLELFTAAGPQAIDSVHAAGAECFLDLKLHDIPATVHSATARAEQLGVRYLTVHAMNGPDGLTAAAQAAKRMQVLAVTVLTSMTETTLHAIGVELSPAQAVSKLAHLASEAGIAGFVTSPLECESLRAAFPSACLVVPGIRGSTDEANDQQRTASASMTIRAGASVLVVGRPIRNAPDPAAAAIQLIRDIEAASS